MKAKFKWMRMDKNGIVVPLQKSKYSTVAKFDGDIENWEKEAWSIVLKNIKALDKENTMIADIQFLASDAPESLLHDGSCFELYEGYHCVAKGVILSAV
jgi:hypothetical protein